MALEATEEKKGADTHLTHTPIGREIKNPPPSSAACLNGGSANGSIPPRMV